jgi:predicted phosphodiesterase
MRLAILADIHGNLPAFEAALKHVARQKVDQIILAGDMIIGSPDSIECWNLAQSLGCPMLRGNHERYVSYYGTPQAAPEWSTERFTPLHWAFAQIPAQERQKLAQLPTDLRLSEAPDLFLVHASERGDHDTVAPHTPEEQLADMFPSAQERFIIRSHNHYAQTRVWERGFIISNGSVGLPLDGNPTAQYLLLDQNKEGWHVWHQSVPYDLDTTIRRFQDTGYLASTGAMGRLFLREVVTATQQIVPFLRLYAQWAKEGDISLNQALERFLNQY